VAKGPRLIDMDILLYGQETMDTPELQVPASGCICGGLCWRRWRKLRPRAAIRLEKGGEGTARGNERSQRGAAGWAPVKKTRKDLKESREVTRRRKEIIQRDGKFWGNSRGHGISCLQVPSSACSVSAGGGASCVGLEASSSIWARWPRRFHASDNAGSVSSVSRPLRRRRKLLAFSREATRGRWTGKSFDGRSCATACSNSDRRDRRRRRCRSRPLRRRKPRRPPRPARPSS